MTRTRNLALISTVVLLTAAPAFAASDAMMRAAKKEGKVTWYTAVALSVAQRICANFNKKDMGVECIVHRDGSGKLYSRYLQEKKGNVFVADVFHTSNLGQFLNLQKKDLIVYNPPGIKKFLPKFRTKHGKWHILRAAMLMPFYNTNKVKPGEVPKSWKDLLNPRWKGRLVTAHPGYSGFVTNGMINLVKLFGWGYYEKLVALKPRVVQSALAPLAMVGRGEADLSMGTPSYGILSAMKKGEPIKPFVPKEGLALVASPQGIIKKAPHPNAGKLFTDYLFGKEAQQMLANEFLYVGHPDVDYPEAMPKLKEMNLLTIDGKELKKKTKPTRAKFRKLFGV